MRISFVLPTRSPVPIGGIRVTYQFANRLADRGHAVSIVQPRTIEPPASILARAKARVWVSRFSRAPRTLVPWFVLDSRIRVLPVTHLDPDLLPDADVVVATPSWEPARCIAFAAESKGRRFYFIQGYDVWYAAEDDVDAAWRLPLQKIVISRWLEEIAERLGEGDRTIRIPMGVDLDSFAVEMPIESRPFRLAALLNPNKGQQEIVEAASLARAMIPALTATYFGTAKRPTELPEWAEYVQLPDRLALRDLYNSAALFLQASREEGWGLPACEAMACGCALITYDTGGSREYAIDGETARVVGQYGARSLADGIIELAGDDALRKNMARRGEELVTGFTWERSVDALEAVLVGRRMSEGVG